jgi:hypothetical protein
LKVSFKRVGEIAHLDADGTPEELAAFVNLSGLAGLAPKPREDEFPRRVKLVNANMVGYERARYLSGRGVMTSVVDWDHLVEERFCPTAELDAE